MDANESLYSAVSFYAKMKRKERALGKGVRRSALHHARGPYRRLFSVASRFLDLGELPGLSEEEARRAEQERGALVEALRPRVHRSAKGTKLHWGPLSPGCVTCQNGEWDCNLLNRRCNRNCDFCKRPHSMVEERPSESEGNRFDTPEEHVTFVRTLGIRGVGFSGGEPLLEEERLLSHVRAVRDAFGSSLYIWMYTNGDLVDRPVLQRLRDAGLDEIRFNLSARGYDLAPVVLARSVLPRVTVEIPAIPEHFEQVRELLPELGAIGVDHLNLHQLYLMRENWRALMSRGYRFVCDPGIAVFESELSALRLLLSACERQLALPVHYCSHAYRLQFPPRGMRMRVARIVCERHQELTEAGYLRQLTVVGARDGRELSIHSGLLGYVDWSTATLNIDYIEPRSSVLFGASAPGPAGPRPEHRVVHSARGLGRAAVECWGRVAEGKASTREALARFLDRQRAAGGSAARAQREARGLIQLLRYEAPRAGLAALY